MDQGPASHSAHLSTPRIVGPRDHDSLDGHPVTIWGTADSGETIELWDWLSLVTTTVTDSEGRWSITLRDVESGDHMYFAQAVRESKTPFDRSNPLIVRVGSPRKQWQAEPARTASLRWKSPRAGIVRRLRGRQRPAKDEDWSEKLVLEQAWEQILAAQQAPPAAESVNGMLLDEPALPEPDDAGPDELSPALTILPEPGAHGETSDDELPTEITATMVEDEQEAIELPAETLVKPPAPMDLGAAAEPIGALPKQGVITEPVVAAAVPKRIWAYRVAGDQRPIYLTATQVIPPISVRYLGTAALVAGSAPDDGSPPSERFPIVSAREEDDQP
jgi:hypothetical protein